MGAATFTSYREIPDLKNAFHNAIDDAAWEHGHGGYTGTIAEKSEVVVVQGDALTIDDAYDLAGTLIQDQDPRIDDKWGPAGAIPVRKPEDPPTAVRGWLFFGWASS